MQYRRSRTKGAMFFRSEMNKANELEAIELTEKEKKIIDARLERYHQNPELGSPWEDVYKRIVSRQEGEA